MIELERKVEALVRCVGRERFDEMLRQLPEADKPMRLGSRDIEDLLTDLGIPSSLQGYDYLADAVEIRIAKPGAHIMTDIYDEIAKKRGKTASKVERSIRTAIENAWYRGNTDVLERMFGYSVNPRTGSPKNKEFIDRVARIIVRRREAGC